MCFARNHDFLPEIDWFHFVCVYACGWVSWILLVSSDNDGVTVTRDVSSVFTHISADVFDGLFLCFCVYACVHSHGSKLSR